MKRICSKPTIYLMPAFLLIILFVLGAIIAPFTSKILFLNLTPSAPMGIYIRDQSTLKKGDYIIIDLPKKIKIDLRNRPWYNGKYLLKKVGAVEGEEFEIKENSFFIQDKKIGQIYKKDGQDMPLPQLKKGKYKVESGHILPISTYARSFDGRYYGMVNTKCIITKVKPFWTREGE